MTDWECCSTPSGAADGPDHPDVRDAEWTSFAAPGTVGAMGVVAGDDIDRRDWWFRTMVLTAEPAATLRFDGLATLATVWVDGEQRHTGANMFRRADVELGDAGAHEVVVACRSVADATVPSSPRARWRTQLIAARALRWIRTSPLGRMPGWTPPTPAVGPWRPVTCYAARSVRLVRTRVLVEVRADGAGVVRFDGDCSVVPTTARLRVGAVTVPLTVEGRRLRGEIEVPRPPLWWPAGHGDPELLDAAVVVETVDGRTTHRLSPIGFRTVAFDPMADDGRGAGFQVNGVDVFCRGAVWMPLDVVSLQCEPSHLRRELERLVDVGVNMLRIPGVTVYECGAFYDLCDELGIMVWHDLMLANFDYPDDHSFVADLDAEVDHLADRIAGRPSLVVVCGGSEVEQQAAMFGAGEAVWTTELAHRVIPGWVTDRFGPVTYVASSPTGGAFPFSPDRGVAHYFGVGAYMRPLGDARAASVRFASECLAFANVPDRRSLSEWGMSPDDSGRGPAWASGVPRDRGADIDFDDVRDHYVGQLFELDPADLRTGDPDRYLDLGRAASFELVRTTVAEWRRQESTCCGALVFMARDVVPGAGWGLVDVAGRPKAAWYGLVAASRSRTVLLLDEALNGLHAHVFNDRPATFEGTLTARLIDSSGRTTATGSTPVCLEGRSSGVTIVDRLFDGFRDITYAYRFGPPGADVVAVELTDRSGRSVAFDHHLVAGRARPMQSNLGLTASPAQPADAERGTSERRVVGLRTRRFAQHVHVSAPGWVAADGWFHLAPGEERSVVMIRDDHGPRWSDDAVVVRAINQVV